MLGTANAPQLKAKAAETHNLIEFLCISMKKRLEGYKALNEETYFTAQLLCECLAGMVSFNNIISTCDREISHATQLELMSLYLKSYMCFDRAGGQCRPKWHLMIHCILKMTWFGNARYYWTYRDEGLNGVLAKIARSCHRRHWQEAVHTKFSICKSLGLANMH